jgi:hypothetical protein
VALAVAVTLTSTLLAFIMTPLWCRALAGRYVPVDALGLCLSTLQVVVAPVLIGVLCNWRFRAKWRGWRASGPRCRRASTRCGCAPHPVLFAHIETIEAVENARAIAAVEAVDVLFVGPADLRFDLEARPSRGTRDYDACLQEVAAAASAAGRQSGILVRDTGELGKLRSLGYTMLAIDSDLGILRAGYQRMIASDSQTL